MIESEEQFELWPDDSRIEKRSAAIRKTLSRSKGILRPREKETNRYAKLVLASGSPSKIKVLELLGLRFKVDPANIDEDSIVMPTAEQLVCELAGRKAVAVAERYKDAIILGADTLIQDDYGTLGKPRNKDDAVAMLQRLSAKTHRVVTGMALLEVASGTFVRKLTTTNVTFRCLSPETVVRYVETGEPIGKAGGYALQGMGALLIKTVDGEYNNVLGLPVATFVEALADMGYELI